MRNNEMRDKKCVPSIRLFLALGFAVVFCASAFSQADSNLIGEDALRGVERKNESWSNVEIYRSANADERFYQVRVFEYQGRPIFVFFGAIFETDEINIYIVEHDGAVILKRRVPYKSGSGYYFDNSSNIQMKDEKVYCFIDREHTGIVVDLANREVILGGSYPFEKPPPFRAEFISPSGRRTAKVGNISLTLVENTTGEQTVLLKQPYSGSWSIGQVAWADDDVFYFDNSGAVACIWKVDLVDRTLSKIVPEHNARHPYPYNDGLRQFVAYIEQNYVKIAQPAP